MSGPIRVLVADDHPVYRDGLRLTLDNWDEAILVGEAGDGQEAVELAAKLEPDVILMDLHMPRLSGVEATSAIVAGNPAVAVVVLTMHEEDDLVAAALRAGARGYLLKGATRDELRLAITTAARGGGTFAPSVVRRLASMVGDLNRPGHPFPTLTLREREVLDLMAQGRSNPEIAWRLGISDKTVRNHTSTIFAKLEVPGRSEAIVRAREAGLGGEKKPA